MEGRCRPCAGITQIRFGGLAGDRPTSQRYRAPLATVTLKHTIAPERSQCSALLGRRGGARTAGGPGSTVTRGRCSLVHRSGPFSVRLTRPASHGLSASHSPLSSRTIAGAVITIMRPGRNAIHREGAMLAWRTPNRTSGWGGAAPQDVGDHDAHRRDPGAQPSPARLDTGGRRPVRLQCTCPVAGGETVSQGPLEPLFQVRILARQPAGTSGMPVWLAPAGSKCERET